MCVMIADARSYSRAKTETLDSKGLGQVKYTDFGFQDRGQGLELTLLSTINIYFYVTWLFTVWLTACSVETCL